MNKLHPGQAFKILGQHFRRKIVSGFLIVLPLMATVLVMKFFFDIIDPIPRDFIQGIIGREFPGIGIAFFVAFIYISGLIGSYVIGVRLISFGHKFADRIPFVRAIYRTAKQTVDSLMISDWSERYSRVVLLEFPRLRVLSVGFVTSSFKTQDDISMIAVYIPTAPLPTSGFVVIVPESDSVATELNVEETMRMVISGGVLTPNGIFENMSSSDLYGSLGKD
jgi:uncharacterized membrane protein